jgi:hypothetical protein
MGVPLIPVVLPEGIIIVNFIDKKIWSFQPSSPQYEGAYVVGNTYTSSDFEDLRSQMVSPEDLQLIDEPTPAN